MSFYTLGIMSAIIAFLGFILENIWLAFTKGYVDNRNMSMPFLFGYGMAVISIYSVFGLPQDMTLFGRIAVGRHSGALYFTAVFFAVSIGEIVLGNALKFTDCGGKICIRLRDNDDHVSVCVSDNGVGISDEDKKRIFEKFYQADFSHASDGNGLGLAITKKIIELHSGTVTVESELNKGSDFIVEMPK